MINNIIKKLNEAGYDCELLNEENIEWILPHIDEYKKDSIEHNIKGLNNHPQTKVAQAVIKVDNLGNLNWLLAPDLDVNLMPSLYMNLKKDLWLSHGLASKNYTIKIMIKNIVI